MRKGEVKMEKFINDQFEGRRKACAVKLDIAESTISRIINLKSRPGRKVILSIIDYCVEKNIDYSKYL